MTATARRQVSAGGPDHRDLLLIVAGLLAGLMLGPHVLGRINPSGYERLFVHGAVGAEHLQIHQRKITELEQRLQATGASPEALGELRAGAAEQLTRRLEESTLQHLAYLRGLGVGLMLALIALMMLETLLVPVPVAQIRDQTSSWRTRLGSARYALAAVWIALALAQPRLLQEVRGLFVALLVLVTLAAMLAPLRRTKPAPAE